MSWEPVTYWTVRCDGRRGRDQPCDQVWTYQDEEEHEWTATFAARELGRGERAAAGHRGWVVHPDGRALCPAHVAAQETMLAAQLDGLPFEEGPG